MNINNNVPYAQLKYKNVTDLTHIFMHICGIRHFDTQQTIYHRTFANALPKHLITNTLVCLDEFTMDNKFGHKIIDKAPFLDICTGIYKGREITVTRKQCNAIMNGKGYIFVIQGLKMLKYGESNLVWYGLISRAVRLYRKRTDNIKQILLSIISTRPGITQHDIINCSDCRMVKNRQL